MSRSASFLSVFKSHSGRGYHGLCFSVAFIFHVYHFALPRGKKTLPSRRATHPHSSGRHACNNPYNAKLERETLENASKAASSVSVPARRQYTPLSANTITCVRARILAISSASSTPPEEGAMRSKKSLQKMRLSCRGLRTSRYLQLGADYFWERSQHSC